MNILDKISINLIFLSILLFNCSVNAEEKTIAEIELGSGESKSFVVDAKKKTMIGLHYDLTHEEAREKCPKTDPYTVIINGEKKTLYKSNCIKLTETNLPKNDLKMMMGMHESYYSGLGGSMSMSPQKGRIEFNVENLADFPIHMTVYHNE